MNVDFENKIKKLIDSGADVFYNTSGDPKAFKMCIRHLSSAPYASLGFMINDEFIPKKPFYLVDLENETITEVFEKIKVINLNHL